MNEMKDESKKRQLKRFFIFSFLSVFLILGLLIGRRFGAYGEEVQSEGEGSKVILEREGMKEGSPDSEKRRRIEFLSEAKKVEGSALKEVKVERTVEVKNSVVRNKDLEEKKLIAKKESADLKKKFKTVRKEKKQTKKKKKKEKLIEEPKAEKELLIIGDSIAYGMSLNNTYTGVDRAADIYWLTEGGVSVAFIPKNLKVTVGKTMARSVTNTLSSSVYVDLVKEIQDKGIRDVAIMLGLNGSSKKNAKTLVERMVSIREKTGCNVYYITVLPMVDSKAKKIGYRVRDSVNVSYNSWVKEEMEGKDLFYVDAYKAVKEMRGYANETQDGIHYSRKVYNKVIECLEKVIEKTRT